MEDEETSLSGSFNGCFECGIDENGCKKEDEEPSQHPVKVALIVV